MTAGLPINTPQSILTLSAVGELEPQDARSAAVIESLLDEGALDRVIDYVWGPLGATESELRFMAGDR